MYTDPTCSYCNMWANSPTYAEPTNYEEVFGSKCGGMSAAACFEAESAAMVLDTFDYTIADSLGKKTGDATYTEDAASLVGAKLMTDCNPATVNTVVFLGSWLLDNEDEVEVEIVEVRVTFACIGRGFRRRVAL